MTRPIGTSSANTKDDVMALRDTLPVAHHAAWRQYRAHARNDEAISFGPGRLRRGLLRRP
jgi:hypothetical protein